MTSTQFSDRRISRAKIRSLAHLLALQHGSQQRDLLDEVSLAWDLLRSQLSASSLVAGHNLANVERRARDEIRARDAIALNSET